MKFLTSSLHSAGFSFIFSLSSRGIRIVNVVDMTLNCYISCSASLKMLLSYFFVYCDEWSFAIASVFAESILDA